MADVTIPLLDGVMNEGSFYRLPFSRSFFLFLLCGKLLLKAHGVRMTFPAKAFAIPHQKLFACRGVGFVTIQTPGLIHHGPVDSVFIKGFIHHGAVASPAQFKPGPFRLKR